MRRSFENPQFIIMGYCLTPCFQRSMHVKRRTLLYHSDNSTALLYVLVHGFQRNLRGPMGSPSKIRLDVSCECTAKQCNGSMFSIFFLPLYQNNACHTSFGFICSDIVFICKVFIHKNAKLEQLNRKCESC